MLTLDRGVRKTGRPVLLIVMYESQTWRVRPGEPFTFGRAAACCAVLPRIDRGVSRTAGSFRFHDGSWWLRNDSSSSMLCVLGDRGFRADLPPGLAVPLLQWHAKVSVNGALDTYILRLRLPDLDDAPDPAAQPPAASGTGERAVTAERIGWQAHTVAKRCENIRDRYVRLGVPGLRGPRALDELALLLISTGELTAEDLRHLPAKAASG